MPPDHDHRDDESIFPRIASTTVHKRWWVSTVKLPFNVGKPGRLPMHYETAVFDLTVVDYYTGDVVLIRHYPTETTARRGHRQIVAHIRKEGTPPRR